MTDARRITIDLKTMVTIMGAVIAIVSGYFLANERTNAKIDATNERIDNVLNLLQSQETLIIENRYKDSMEIDFLKQQFKK